MSFPVARYPPPNPSTVGARQTPATRSKLTIRRPPGRWPGLALGELWRYRDVCLVIARRSLMVRYRQTLLGAAWAIIQPLALMVALTVFFGIIGRVARQGDVPFPVYFMPAIAIWHASARLVSQATTSVVQNKALIEKVYFPRVFFPISAALVALVDLFFALVAMAAIVLLYGATPNAALLLSPFLFAIAFAAALGIGMWLSALNAKYRDINQALPFIVQLWFFASPILYPAAFVPEPWHLVYYLNPLALAITGFRWAVADLPPPAPEAWIISPLVALALLVSGYIFFRTRQGTLDDVL